MARVYLSDPVEMTWEQPEHETFALLAERIEDYLAAQPMAMNEPADDGLDIMVEHDIVACNNYETCCCLCIDCDEHESEPNFH